jgi:hypothetical protein
MLFFGIKGIPFQNKQRSLATKTKNPETGITNPPKADTKMENSNITEGMYDNTLSFSVIMDLIEY